MAPRHVSGRLAAFPCLARKPGKIGCTRTVRYARSCISTDRWISVARRMKRATGTA
jgi:hypothetical protein